MIQAREGRVKAATDRDKPDTRNSAWNTPEYEFARRMLVDSRYRRGRGGGRIEVVGLSGCGEMVATTAEELEEFARRCNGDASYTHITPDGRVRLLIRLNAEGRLMRPAEIAAEVRQADFRAFQKVEKKHGASGTAEPAGDSDKTLIWRSLSDIQPADINWLWLNRVAKGKCNLFFGDGGVGKSFALADMMARITTGTPWPDCQDTPSEPGYVILLNAEDDPNDTIRVRFDTQGGDPTKVAFVDGVKRSKDGNDSWLSLVADLDMLAQLATDKRAKLLIVDPVTAYTDGRDIYKDDQVRTITTPLKAMGERLKMAVVLVMHTNKTGTTNAKYKAANSAAWINACRMAWMFAEDPNDPRRRSMTNAKNNLVYNSSGLSFTFDEAEGRLMWDAEPFNKTANQVLEEQADNAKAGQRREAEEFLKRELANGPVDSNELKDRAKQEDISFSTLKRAKKNLKVASKQDGYGGGWRWKLPAEDQ